jgi:predicted aminopeptidase
LRSLALTTRLRLAQIYEQSEAPSADKESLRALKNSVMQDFRADYARLKTSWGGYAAYDAWVASANNAALSAQGAYDELVPAFEAMFERADRDWLSFYAAVKHVSQMPKMERTQALKQILAQRSSG